MSKTGLYLQAEMETSSAGGSIALASKSNVTLLLDFETCQNIISAVVTSRILHTSHDLVPTLECSAVITDVSQNAWVKFLVATQSTKREIISPGGYLTSIARSESIDEIRRRKSKSTLPLSLSQDGELLQGKVLLPVHQEMQDPSALYELKESFQEYIDEIVQLPARQMYAMICELKEDLGPTFPLAELFGKHGIDIGPIHWPREDPKELQRLRSLLSIARETLREKFHRCARQNRRSKSTQKAKDR